VFYFTLSMFSPTILTSSAQAKSWCVPLLSTYKRKISCRLMTYMNYCSARRKPNLMHITTEYACVQCNLHTACQLCCVLRHTKEPTAWVGRGLCNPRFITAFTRARHRPVFRASGIQSTPFTAHFLTCILMLPTSLSQAVTALQFFLLW
jgi:hypothetical protein